jgi:hypothetical protein
LKRKRRPKTDLEPQFTEIANKMYILEKENDRLGKIIEIAFETLEIIWETTHDKRVQIGMKKMAKAQTGRKYVRRK